MMKGKNAFIKGKLPSIWMEVNKAL